MRRDALILSALLAACALVVVLVLQNRALQRDFADFTREEAAPAAGDWWPSLAVRDDATGRARTLGRADPHRLQVLYFFEPDCLHCRATAPAVRMLEAATARERLAVDMVGISHAPAPVRDAYMHAEAFDFPAVAGTHRIASLFRLKVVPLLVAVDGEGRVAYAHAGELVTRDEVEHLLAVVRREAHASAATTKE